MLNVEKNAALIEQNIPFALLEVWYPNREEWREADFQAAVKEELAALKAQYSEYDRKAVFGENPYFHFFKKFKKTYPVMMQFESFLLKDRPFPIQNPVTAVPFLVELQTQALSGTHDADHIEGPLKLFLGTEKAPFVGLRGEEVHTYPGDVCGMDNGGIILSMIAGADNRTCTNPNSRHVVYPVFGTPGMPADTLKPSLERLRNNVSILAPFAEMQSQTV